MSHWQGWNGDNDPCPGCLLRICNVVYTNVTLWNRYTLNNERGDRVRAEMAQLKINDVVMFLGGIERGDGDVRGRGRWFEVFSRFSRGWICSKFSEPLMLELYVD